MTAGRQALDTLVTRNAGSKLELNHHTMPTLRYFDSAQPYTDTNQVSKPNQSVRKIVDLDRTYSLDERKASQVTTLAGQYSSNIQNKLQVGKKENEWSSILDAEHKKGMALDQEKKQFQQKQQKELSEFLKQQMQEKKVIKQIDNFEKERDLQDLVRDMKTEMYLVNSESKSNNTRLKQEQQCRVQSNLLKEKKLQMEKEIVDLQKNHATSLTWGDKEKEQAERRKIQVRLGQEHLQKMQYNEKSRVNAKELNSTQEKIDHQSFLDRLMQNNFKIYKHEYTKRLDMQDSSGQKYQQTHQHCKTLDQLAAHDENKARQIQGQQNSMLNQYESILNQRKQMEVDELRKWQTQFEVETKQRAKMNMEQYEDEKKQLDSHISRVKQLERQEKQDAQNRKQTYKQDIDNLVGIKRQKYFISDNKLDNKEVALNRSLLQKASD